MHDLDELKERFRVEDAWEALALTGTPGKSCKCPWRDDRHASFSVFDEGRKWNDFSTAEHGDVIDFIARALDLDASEACRRFLAMAGNGSPPSGQVPSRKNENHAGEPARKREAWPTFEPLTTADIQALAALRHLPADAVEILSKSTRTKLIHAAAVDGHRSFVFREGTFAQARRFDGEPFAFDGSTIKSKNLPGSTGAFIGRKLLGETPPILLVEGVIGMLEAVAAIVLTDRTDWTALAATSASSRFARDPELLAMLRGRRVRIVPDHDAKGQGFDAAAAWIAELESTGAIVDAFPLPTGCKDLGDIVSDPTAHIGTLNSLFSL